MIFIFEAVGHLLSLIYPSNFFSLRSERNVVTLNLEVFILSSFGSNRIKIFSEPFLP